MLFYDRQMNNDNDKIETDQEKPSDGFQPKLVNVKVKTKPSKQSSSKK